MELSSRERLDSLSETVNDEWHQDIALKRQYAKAALIGMAVQVGVADLVFIAYTVAVGFRVPNFVMSAWLGATVVQVVALALTVTRGLFPPQRR